MCAEMEGAVAVVDPGCVSKAAATITREDIKKKKSGCEHCRCLHGDVSDEADNDCESPKDAKVQESSRGEESDLVERITDSAQCAADGKGENSPKPESKPDGCAAPIAASKDGKHDKPIDDGNFVTGSPRGGSRPKRLSDFQVREMDSLFRVNQSPLEEERATLAANIGLRERQVATWFQNKRARTKHKYIQADADQLRQENVAMMRELEQHRSLKDHILNQVSDLRSANAKLEAEIYSLRAMVHTNSASSSAPAKYYQIPQANENCGPVTIHPQHVSSQQLIKTININSLQNASSDTSCVGQATASASNGISVNCDKNEPAMPGIDVSQAPSLQSELKIHDVIKLSSPIQGKGEPNQTNLIIVQSSGKGRVIPANNIVQSKNFADEEYEAEVRSQVENAFHRHFNGELNPAAEISKSSSTTKANITHQFPGNGAQGSSANSSQTVQLISQRPAVCTTSSQPASSTAGAVVVSPSGVANIPIVYEVAGQVQNHSKSCVSGAVGGHVATAHSSLPTLHPLSPSQFSSDANPAAVSPQRRTQPPIKQQPASPAGGAEYVLVSGPLPSSEPQKIISHQPVAQPSTTTSQFRPGTPLISVHQHGKQQVGDSALSSLSVQNHHGSLQFTPQIPHYIPQPVVQKVVQTSQQNLQHHVFQLVRPGH